jgi:ethanolamine utilization protein EutA (predicted chaperonin)
MHGTDILQANTVSNISYLGFWIIVNNKEYFVPFKDYPVFKKSSLDHIFKVKMISPQQLRWKDLDVDIEIDALERPTLFPLQYK